VKKIAAVLLAAGVMLTGCGGGQRVQSASAYCTDQFGTVIDYAYCNPGNSHYNGSYQYWHDSSHHNYKHGYVIPRKTFRSGLSTTRKPSATALTIPKSTPKPSSVKPSTPAKPQTSPSRSSSTTRSTTGSTSRSSSSSTSKSSSSSGTRK
jgi:hypothetical protein